MESSKGADKDGIVRHRNENGLFHREDGPAIEYEYGTKSWWINDERHREDGPAVIWSDGHVEYWMRDVEYTADDYLLKVSLLKLERIKDL